VKVVIVALGSAGDVHPLTGLALALRERGHRPLLAASPVFRSLAEREGLPFAAIGTEDDFTAAVNDPDIWHPLKAFGAIVRRLIIPSMRPVYELVERESREADTVVVAPVTAFGARLAEEKLGVPLATVHLQPLLIRSRSAPSCFGFPDVLSLLPRSLRKLSFALADRLIVDPALAPSTNALRAELGLPPVRRVLLWADSSRLILGLFPPWFAEPQPDWSSRVQLAGFPLYDESTVVELPGALRAWLGEGDPPVVFTAGSAMVQGENFFRVSVEVCRRGGRRGLLLTRFPRQLPPSLPPGVRTFSYAPFSLVFPASAAVVHHGGIGTVAQALAAGIPQLIVPFAHDQPDNACRVRRLSAGTMILSGAYRPRRAVRELDRLVASEQTAAVCRGLAARVDGKAALERACSLIEGLLSPGR
jgi:UDP:flavonoid glycosyltransferase YjiC (YdhE family)